MPKQCSTIFLLVHNHIHITSFIWNNPVIVDIYMESFFYKNASILLIWISQNSELFFPYIFITGYCKFFLKLNSWYLKIIGLKIKNVSSFTMPVLDLISTQPRRWIKKINFFFFLARKILCQCVYKILSSTCSIWVCYQL